MYYSTCNGDHFMKSPPVWLSILMYHRTILNCFSMYLTDFKATPCARFSLLNLDFS